MGNIYTRDIKRIVREIYEKYKDEVSTDFAKNKELVKTIVDVKSKKVRNRIAGYLTRYARLMKESAEKKAEQEQVADLQ